MSSNKYNFSGKVALVTGSSSGIGQEIAIQFAQYGAKVTITGRIEENLNKVAERIREFSDGQENVLTIVGDLLDRSLAPKLIQQTIDKFGRLDILVNNAGGGDPNDTSYNNLHLLDAYDNIMNLNVRSVLQLTQLAVPHLERTKGNVINISSVASTKPLLLIYSTSKAALDMLTKTSAGQLAPKGIRVNSINPGSVKTNIVRSQGRVVDHSEEHERASIKRWCALDRLGTVEDIANLASFLASDDAVNITGSLIVSDSGALVKMG